MGAIRITRPAVVQAQTTAAAVIRAQQELHRPVTDLRKEALVEGAAVADVIIGVTVRVKVDKVKAKDRQKSNNLDVRAPRDKFV
jgi:hypothetical protein